MVDTITPDVPADARAEAFVALEGHPMIMQAVVQAFKVVYAELDALRAGVVALEAPAAVATAPADAGTPAAVVQP